jgi:apolipoprotein N-acyltransferase
VAHAREAEQKFFWFFFFQKKNFLLSFFGGFVAGVKKVVDAGLTLIKRAFARRHDGICFVFLVGLASALALPPVHLVPVLLWTVPALLRRVEAAASWQRAAMVAVVFGFGVNLGGLYWITEPLLTELSDFWWLLPFAAPLLALAVAFFTVIPVLGVYWLRPGLGRLLVFCGLWVLSDIVRQFAFSGFPWNFWGTDWAMPGILGDIFIQPAAYISVYGLTLLTVFCAGLPLFGRRGYGAVFGIVMVWAGLGEARLRMAVPETGVTLALVQPDFPVPGLYDRASLLNRWNQLLAMSAAGINNGANAVMWPEGASPWFLDTDPVARQQLVAVVGPTPVLAGSLRIVSNTDFRNSLVVIDGPGPAAGTYDKWKLVPFGEYVPRWIPLQLTPPVLQGGFTPGGGPKTLTVPGLPAFGALICYEAIFPGQIVDGAHRPAFLVNITDDAWFGDSSGPRQHFADVRLRAVEEGLPLARDANSGISAMINSFGQVTARLPLKNQGVLVVKLPGALPPTLFAHIGLVLPAGLATLTVAVGLTLTILGSKNKYSFRRRMSI